MCNFRWLLSLLAPVQIVGGCGVQPDPRWTTAAIIDGTLDSGHPSVGKLQAGASGTVKICTATLIGLQTAITAAHCIRPAEPHTLELGGAPLAVQSVVQHEGWNSENKDYPNDLAILKLQQTPQVAPSAIVRRAPRTGEQVTLVGFGATADGLNDLGTKRSAVNNVEVVQPTRFSLLGTGNGTGSTCNGDSGGPALMWLEGKELLVGVGSAGVQPCGTLAWETRIDAFWDWIVDTSAGDVTIETVTETPRALVGGCQLGGRVDLTLLALLPWLRRRPKSGRRGDQNSYFSP